MDLKYRYSNKTLVWNTSAILSQWLSHLFTKNRVFCQITQPRNVHNRFVISFFILTWFSKTIRCVDTWVILYPTFFSKELQDKIWIQTEAAPCSYFLLSDKTGFKRQCLIIYQLVVTCCKKIQSLSWTCSSSRFSFFSWELSGSLSGSLWLPWYQNSQQTWL